MTEEEERAASRIYKREWVAPVWRGSLAELIDASETALEELGKTAPRETEAMSIDLEFFDGDQTFRSLTSLEETMRQCNPADVAGFHFDVEGPDGFSVRISGGARTGIHVVATGSETFAIGMVIALKSRLSGGVDAGEKAARVPADAADLIAGTLVGCLAIAVGAFCLDRGLGVAVSGLFALTALGVCTQTASATVWARRDERRPPAFRVVPEGHQFPDEAAGDGGVLWKAKEWLDRHPGLGPGLGLAVGALLTRLAQEINF